MDAWDATMWAQFWSTVALVIFLAIVVYLKVPGMVAKALDERAAKITEELDSARRLREEAAALLVEYQKKREEAEKDAEEIVAAAKREADALSADARQKTAEYVARRTALSEQKIAQAESDAVAAVRAAAVDLAVAASEKMIAANSGSISNDLFKSSVEQVRTKLN